MLIFLPIATQGETHRFPLMTMLLALALVASGTLIQVQYKQIDDEVVRLRIEHEVVLEELGFQRPPLEKELPAAREEFIQRLLAGEVVPQTGSLYTQWHRLYSRLRDAESRDLLVRWSLRPGGLFNLSLLLHPFVTRDFWMLLAAGLLVWSMGCSIEPGNHRSSVLVLWFSGAVVGGMVTRSFSTADVGYVGPAAALAGVLGGYMVATRGRRISIWTIFAPGRALPFSPHIVTVITLAIIGLMLVPHPSGGTTRLLGAPGTVLSLLAGIVIASAFGWRAIDFDEVSERGRRRSQRQTEQRLVEAVEYYQKGQFQMAEDVLLEILRTEPEHLRANELLVKVYMEGPISARSAVPMSRVLHFLVAAGDVDGAYRYFVRFRDALPDGRLNPKALYELGQGLQSRHRFENAVDVYETLSAQYGPHPLALKGLHNAGVICMDNLQDYNRARQLLLRLREIAPDSTWRETAEQALQRISW
jgi:tetratricopeptide (TPR) repeat protein